jgi:hypothetical protein
MQINTVLHQTGDVPSGCGCADGAPLRAGSRQRAGIESAEVAASGETKSGAEQSLGSVEQVYCRLGVRELS